MSKRASASRALKDDKPEPEGGSAPSWWSSGPQLQLAKPPETQTAVAVPKKPRAPPKPAEDACAQDGLLGTQAVGKKPCIKPGSGESFQDCPDCPEMVVAPAGSFTMGSPESEPERYGDEGPQHKVTIAKPFAVGRFAVTFAEWDACVAEAAAAATGRSDEGWGRADRPVINVNWNDAKAYVAWLSQQDGQGATVFFRRPSGKGAGPGQRRFWWGSSITPEQANYDGSIDPYKGGGAKGSTAEKLCR